LHRHAIDWREKSMHTAYDLRHSRGGSGKRVLLTALLALAVLVGLCISALIPLPPLPLPPLAAPPQDRYYPQTQHYVEVPFLPYFDAHGGPGLIGYPVSEQYPDERTGLLTQCYQNLCLELQTEGPGAGIHPLALGEELQGALALPTEPISNPPPDSDDTRYFPETGHTTAYAFLHFYKAQTDPDFTGYPITEPLPRNGHIYQYFQHLALDYWQDGDGRPRIALVHLGDLYAEARVPAAHMMPQRGPAQAASVATVTPEVRSMSLKLTLQRAVATAGEEQVVYVQVSDQNGRPVAHANAQITWRTVFNTHAYTDLRTNDEGYAALSFTPQRTNPGEVITIDVSVWLGESLAASQSASYTIVTDHP
jgi:hypothetical protein